MTDPDYLRLQLVVALVAAPFTNICITQPALRDEDWAEGRQSARATGVGRAV